MNPKGHLISKCLFGVFKFFQKTNKNKSTWGIIVAKSNFFICFLEELRIPKSPFEINWPLASGHIWHMNLISCFFQFLTYSRAHFFTSYVNYAVTPGCSSKTKLSISFNEEKKKVFFNIKIYASENCNRQSSFGSFN